MESNGCGDAPAPKFTENQKPEEPKVDENKLHTPAEPPNEKPDEICEITAQMLEEKEKRLRDRIAQCRNLVESLKLELEEEKAKLKSSKQQPCYCHSMECLGESSSLRNSVEVTTSDKYDLCYPTDVFSACVDSKLARDDNLLEYEKQLEQYQNTLNMAQITKKQAIRKQMLAKAFSLKLLEVENQCNIELLRVKQNLQCLEPLQLIADKWNTDKEDVYDPGNFQLTIPQYPDSWSKLGDSSASTSGTTPREEEKLEEDPNAALKSAISE